ncbi:hypothetical protein POJ06DRAFT_245354, partial [Lipomyces tetrasporus]
PWIAEVAMVDKAYGAYNLMLGGGYVRQRLNKLCRSSVNEEQNSRALEAVIQAMGT